MVEHLPDKTSGNDCYSAGERKWMLLGQRLRSVCLRPILRLLTRLRITPDMITLLSAVCGVAFAPLWVLGHSTAAVVLLMLHVALDGLDGPLAREQHVDSPRGSFTDTFADQVVLTAVTSAWMIQRHDPISTCAGTLYLFTYTAVVGMAMVRNALSIPYSWLVRPRFFFYGALMLECMGIRELSLPVLVISTALLSIKTLSGFFKLRARIAGPSEVSGPSD